MITDAMFTNYGNLAFIANSEDYDYIEHICKVNRLGFKQLPHPAIYETIPEPRITDDRYCVNYVNNLEEFHKVIKLSNSINGISFILIIIEGAISNLYGFNQKGQHCTVSENTLLKLVSNYYRGCNSDEDIADKILDDIHRNGYRTIQESTDDYKLSTESYPTIYPLNKIKQN